MKRIIAFSIALLCFANCIGCTAKTPASSSQSSSPAVSADPSQSSSPAVSADPSQSSTPDVSADPSQSSAPVLSGKDALNGKKILFVGNSYTFYGNVVLRQGSAVLDQETRSNDMGYFYHLCKSQGVDVSVTNWAFPDHNLFETLGTACTRDTCPDVNHLSYLTDRYFDYVVLQPFFEGKYTGDLNVYLKPMMDIFREVNPNVKFLLSVPHMAYDKNYTWVPKLYGVDQDTITLCNWGRMLNSIVKGLDSVPGATQEYDRSTFVISADGHHQNPLVGYLTAAMVYCTITGESAVGLPYDFCGDSSINPKFDLEQFKLDKYPNNQSTNFIEVFHSPADMNGLQQMIDLYIEEPLA